MKRSVAIKFASMLVAGTLLAGGCSFNGLMRNIWVGFGEGIGNVPGNTLAGVITNALGIQL